MKKIDKLYRKIFESHNTIEELRRKKESEDWQIILSKVSTEELRELIKGIDEDTLTRTRFNEIICAAEGPECSTEEWEDVKIRCKQQNKED